MGEVCKGNGSSDTDDYREGHNDEYEDAEVVVTRRRNPRSDRKVMSSAPVMSTRQINELVLSRDADDFESKDEMINNAKWQKVGNRIDETSRVLFPIAFCLFIIIIL